MSLKPFLYQGSRPAVVITAPSQLVSGSIVVSAMAGVVHRPQSSTSQSAAVRPLMKAAASFSPLRRESRPTEITSRSVVVCVLSASHSAKA